MPSTTASSMATRRPHASAPRLRTAIVLLSLATGTTRAETTVPPPQGGRGAVDHRRFDAHRTGRRAVCAAPRAAAEPRPRSGGHAFRDRRGRSRSDAVTRQPRRLRDSGRGGRRRGSTGVSPKRRSRAAAAPARSSSIRRSSARSGSAGCSRSRGSCTRWPPDVASCRWFRPSRMGHPPASWHRYRAPGRPIGRPSPTGSSAPRTRPRPVPSRRATRVWSAGPSAFRPARVPVDDGLRPHRGPRG